MDPLTILGLLVVLYGAYIMMGSETPKLNMPSTDPDTSTVNRVPVDTTASVVRRVADLTHVPDGVGMDKAQIELYTEKDFGGTKRTLYPGMKDKFAEMTSGGQIAWKYQSMKVVPGTYIMLTSSVGGSMDRGFAVGKHEVPDMYAFITSYDSIYDQKGIFMDRDYWARPFYIQVLTDVQWDEERAKKYEACINTTKAWDYDDAKGKEFCEYAEPEANMSNITGFRSGIRGGLARTGFHDKKDYY